jgi:hypothetical protein
MKKFTQLPPASLPLAGTEIACIVQEGTSKRVAVSEFGGGSGSSESALYGITEGTDTIDSPLVSFDGEQDHVWEVSAAAIVSSGGGQTITNGNLYIVGEGTFSSQLVLISSATGAGATRTSFTVSYQASTQHLIVSGTTAVWDNASQAFANRVFVSDMLDNFKWKFTMDAGYATPASCSVHYTIRKIV